MQITGIILAGGKSIRMGADKALLTIGGRTLLTRAVEFCRPFCNQVIISSDSSVHEMEGTERVADEYPGCGPLGGIYSCLKHSANEWNFVLSVDAPFPEMSFVEWLSGKTGGHRAVVPKHQKGTEPLLAFYSKNCLFKMEKHLKSGRYKMQDVLESTGVLFPDVQEWVNVYPRLFYNLNHTEDFNGLN